MAYTDDQMGPRRLALVGSLAGNTGISGAMPGGKPRPDIGGGLSSMVQGATVKDELSPDQASADAWKNNPANPLRAMMAGIAPPAGTPAPALPGAALPGGAVSGAVDYTKVGQFIPGNGSGYDPTKGLDGGNTGKYKMRNVLSHFDPNKGLTPEIVDALNAQGMGKFRMADGDELVLDDNGADSSFGRTRHFDVIPKFDDKSRDHAWGYYQQDKGGVMQGQAAPRIANPMFAGSTIGAPLQGDAQANIQAALQGMSAQNQPSRIQQLIAALQGGGQ